MTYEEYKRQQELESQQRSSASLNGMVDSAASSVPTYGAIYAGAKQAEGIGRGMITKDAYGQPKGRFNKSLDSTFTPLHERNFDDIANEDWVDLTANNLSGGAFSIVAPLFGYETKQQKAQKKSIDAINNPDPVPVDNFQTARTIGQKQGQNAAGFNAPQRNAYDPSLGYQSGINYGGGNYGGGYGMSGGGNTNNQSSYKMDSYSSGNPYGGYGGYVQAGVGLGQMAAGYYGLQQNQMPDDLQLTPEMQQALTRANQMAKQGYSQQEVANYMQTVQRMQNQRYRMGVTKGGQNLSNAVTAASNFGNLGQANQFAAGDAQLRRSNIRYADTLAGRTQQIADANNARHWQLWNQKEQAYGNLMQQGMNNSIQGAGNINYGNRTINDPNKIDSTFNDGLNNPAYLNNINDYYNGAGYGRGLHGFNY
jgi:hypothetical protein